jgi:hypothetical protein
MSLWWNYVSELQPPSGLLFILQVIYEHVKARWNDIDREKPKKSEEQLSQCHFVHYKSSLGLTLAQTRVFLARGRRLIAWARARSWLSSKVICVKWNYPVVTDEMYSTVINDFQIRCLKFCSLYGLIIFHFTHPLLHHHHIAMKELGHLLTHSGLTHPEVSSLAFLGSFCLLGRSFSQSTPVQRLNPTTGLTLLWDRNPFRGHFNHWQDSQAKARYC